MNVSTDQNNQKWIEIKRGPILELGYNIRTIRELLGYMNISTIMVYAHVLIKGGHWVYRYRPKEFFSLSYTDYKFIIGAKND